ncbi:protein of unknown function [Actinopolyspora lacussalsi subsp. righensis]|uniref:DUF397 domain-containing protein n=1 Tax=Actinopolyspora righensis TaxID=995060 RepID=A0A1I6YE66_9ACTN|nr:DUF397 domain-containing protein [Actinopolyspora righensis]SFT48825.1 protein of unknown function [Actinopolyspora righensis]
MNTLPHQWRKSSYSGPNSSCLEIGRINEGAAVRDTKNRSAGYLTANHQQWTTFINAVKSSRFN